jgi:hypothetical protein
MMYGTELAEVARYTYCTKFHDDRFGHSSNIKVITSKIEEDSVLVLLRGGIF